MNIAQFEVDLRELYGYKDKIAASSDIRFLTAIVGVIFTVSGVFLLTTAAITRTGQISPVIFVLLLTAGSTMILTGIAPLRRVWLIERDRRRVERLIGIIEQRRFEVLNSIRSSADEPDV